MVDVVSDRDAPIDVGLLIGGEWIGRQDRIQVHNPARPLELVGTIVRGTPADVEAAVHAAKNAQKNWSAKSFAERAATLATALDRIDQDVERRVRLLVREKRQDTCRSQCGDHGDSTPAADRAALCR